LFAFCIQPTQLNDRVPFVDSVPRPWIDTCVQRERKRVSPSLFRSNCLFDGRTDTVISFLFIYFLQFQFYYFLVSGR
jgi:hypothetical protein